MKISVCAKAELVPAFTSSRLHGSLRRVCHLCPDGNEEEITHVPHEAVVGPACDCGGETRLAVIEPHALDKHTDVRNYECRKCDLTWLF